MSKEIGRLIARRALGLVVIMLLVSFAVFALLDLAPGSAERSLLGTRPATSENLREIRELYNLDEPFLVRYRDWLGDALRLDFGTSIQKQQPVADLIEQRLPVSLALVALATMLGFSVGLLLGVVSALRPESVLDRSIGFLTIVGISTPAFVSGLFLLYLFTVRLQWFPSSAAAGTTAASLVLPAAALAAGVLALITKIVRTAMLRELARDHVTFARARGLSGTRVLWAHGVRNALIPAVTSAGLVVSAMLGGTVLVEYVFSINGIGSLLVESTLSHDFPVVQALTLLIALVVVVVSLCVDLCYLALDPRVRFATLRARRA